MTTHTDLAAHGGNTGPSLPLLARLYTQGRYTRASVDTNHFGQPLTSLSNAAEWRQIAILRWQMIEDLTRERDALVAALSTERLAGGGEPYGRVTVVRRPGCVEQHYFYRWPDPPYLDNAAECHTVYTTPPPQDKEILSMVADVAHCGGLAGLGEADALALIRRLTIGHWDKTKLPEQAAKDIRAARTRGEGSGT